MRLTLVSALVVVLVGRADFPDDWPAPSPQIFASAGGSYGLRTIPPKPAVPPETRPFSGRSQATLFALNTDGSERPLWKGHLVNIPYRAVVSDNGRFFVTFDTWGRVGFEHSLVVYSATGRATADVALEPLLSLTPADMFERVRHSVSSRWWRTDAKVEFTGDTDQLVITLQWGQVIRVTLATGTIDRS